MSWIGSYLEAIWLVCLNLADVLVRREPSEGLQSLGEVVSVQEGGKMIPELLVGYANGGFDEKRAIGGGRMRYQVFAASRRRLFERPALAEGVSDQGH